MEPFEFRACSENLVHFGRGEATLCEREPLDYYEMIKTVANSSWPNL